MLEGPKQLAKGLILRVIRARNERERLDIQRRGAAPTPACWGASVGPAGHLELGGCDVTALAREYGTPLHVVHEERLVANYTGFLGAFRACYPRVELGYSYKTNPLPAAIAVLHEAGAVAEVISHFELWLALRLGVTADRIVFNGPGKTPAGLKLAVEQGVRIINLDNVDEAAQIQQFAAGVGRRQPVGVRVVTSVGWSGQFGINLANGDAFAAFERIRSCDRLEPVGLHVHLGTGIKSPEMYARSVGELLEFALLLRERLGIGISFFDLGGGFGVPTVAGFTPMDLRLLAMGEPSRAIDLAAAPGLDAYARAIGSLFDRYYPGPDRPTIFFEPGRALSSSAQTLLLSVLALKPGRRGGHNVILDGGRNVAFPTDYQFHQIYPAAQMLAAPEVHYDFFGPLCHPGDVLFQCRRLPRIAVGDVIAVMDSGAYFIPNQMNFSNPRAAAVIVRDGRARVARAREQFDDMVALDRL